MKSEVYDKIGYHQSIRRFKWLASNVIRNSISDLEVTQAILEENEQHVKWSRIAEMAVQHKCGDMIAPPDDIPPIGEDALAKSHPSVATLFRKMQHNNAILRFQSRLLNAHYLRVKTNEFKVSIVKKFGDASGEKLIMDALSKAMAL